MPGEAPPSSLPSVEDETPAYLAPLTERERQVAALVARGLTNRGIADALGVSTGTARLHVEHILRKLGCHSRAQVAVWAVENGLTAGGA